MSTVANRYYPTLSELITVDDLPDFLSFVENDLNSLLESIFYKNFQYSKGLGSGSGFFQLDVITKNVGLDLPFGLRFVLNPDTSGDSNISAFPISIKYQWPILDFIKSFDLQQFAFTPQAFFELGLLIFRISDKQVISIILKYFVTPSSADVTLFQQLTDDINTLYPDANLQLPAGGQPTLEEFANLITQNSNIPDSIPEVMFAAYILSTDLQTLGTRVQQFFNVIVPDGIQDYIKGLVTPKFQASLTESSVFRTPMVITATVG